MQAQYINETKRRDERRRRMVSIANRLRGDLECLRYCLVQNPQSVKPHRWEDKRYILPTKHDSFFFFFLLLASSCFFSAYPPSPS